MTFSSLSERCVFFDASLLKFRKTSVTLLPKMCICYSAISLLSRWARLFKNSLKRNHGHLCKFNFRNVYCIRSWRTTVEVIVAGLLLVFPTINNRVVSIIESSSCASFVITWLHDGDWISLSSSVTPPSCHGIRDVNWNNSCLEIKSWRNETTQFVTWPSCLSTDPLSFDVWCRRWLTCRMQTVLLPRTLLSPPDRYDMSVYSWFVPWTIDIGHWRRCVPDG